MLHDLSNRAGLPSISLWAAVPHYLPSSSNPKAALALVERATALLGVSVDTEPLERAASNWEAGVARLVDESEELRDYVARLESALEEGDEEDGEAGPPTLLASDESIADEVERFLREQGPG